MGGEPEPGQHHKDEGNALPQPVGGESEQHHRQQRDRHPDRVGGLLADLACEPHPERDGGNGDHQQQDHRQRDRPLVLEDVLVVVDEHGFHDRHRGAVGEPGGQQEHIGLVGEHILQRFQDAFTLGLLHGFGFAHADKGDQERQGCQEPEDGRHANITGGARGEERHDWQRCSRPQDGTDHRKRLLVPGDIGALVVILADLGQDGVVGNIGEGIYGAEEDVRQQRPPELACLGCDVGVAEHQHEGDPERDGEEQDVRSAAAPAGAGVVRNVADERVDDCIPDLADQQRCPGEGGTQAHLVGEEIHQPERGDGEEDTAAELSGAEPELGLA